MQLVRGNVIQWIELSGDDGFQPGLWLEKLERGAGNGTQLGPPSKQLASNPTARYSGVVANCNPGSGHATSIIPSIGEILQHVSCKHIMQQKSPNYATSPDCHRIKRGKPPVDPASLVTASSGAACTAVALVQSRPPQTRPSKRNLPLCSDES